MTETSAPEAWPLRSPAVVRSADAGTGRLPPPPPDPRHQVVPFAVMAECLANWATPTARDEGWRDRAVAEAASTLTALLEAGLGHTIGPGHERLLDPVAVMNVLTWAGQNGEDNLWRRRPRPDLKPKREATGPPAAGPVHHRLRLRRVFGSTDASVGENLVLKLPLPLDGPDHRLVEVRPIAPSGAQIRITQGCLTARLGREGRDEVGLEAEVVIAPAAEPAHPRAMDADERRLWLRPSEGLIQLTDRVRALANHLGAGRSDRDAVLAFWAFVHESLCQGVIHYDAFSAETALDWALDHRWFDCQTGTSLLVALCRARGVPARLVAGYFLNPVFPTNHCWAELWLEDEGWRPADLFGWWQSRGGQDLAWRDRFLFSLEPRLVTQRPPRQVTGPSSVKFPARWQMRQHQSPCGARIEFRNVEDGGLIHEDHITFLP